MRKKQWILAGVIILCLILTIPFWGEKNVQINTEQDTYETEAITQNSQDIAEEKKEKEEALKPKTKEPEIKTDKKAEPKEQNTEIVPKEAEEVSSGEEKAEQKEELTCTLYVRCDDVFNNLNKLSDEKRKVVPEDGIIFDKEELAFIEGESVFDVLKRELIRAGIPFEFQKTPMYDSYYIEGIGNLYEFDCGDMSGWLYKVNGIKPTYGCSEYKLKNGDRVEFLYSCNFLDNSQ